MPAIPRLVNAVPRLVLASPLHRLLSARYLVLHFTGRTTGRHYAVPVAYVRDGDRLLVSTDSRWWRNLADGRPVTVVLRGHPRTGTAERVADPVRAAAALRALVDVVPGYARAAGLQAIDGRVPDDAVTSAVTGAVTGAVDQGVADPRVVLAITLATGGAS